MILTLWDTGSIHIDLKGLERLFFETGITVDYATTAGGTAMIGIDLLANGGLLFVSNGGWIRRDYIPGDQGTLYGGVPLT